MDVTTTKTTDAQRQLAARFLDFWRVFGKNRMAVLGLAMLAVSVLVGRGLKVGGVVSVTARGGKVGD